MNRLRAGGGGSGSSADVDASGWAARVTAAGGTYSAPTLSAVNTFVLNAKANGYWTKLNRINLFCGNQLAAALVPLKIGGGSTTETNVNFVAGDYTEATGITGNGSTKYLNTGMVPSTSLASVNSCHLAAYSRLPSAVGAGSSTLGCASAGSAFLQMAAPAAADGKVYSWCGGGLLVTAAAATPPYRLVQGNRSGAGADQIYQGGTSIASSAGGTTSLPTVFASVFARNSSGVITDYCAQVLGGYSFGDGFTAAEAASYAADMQTFQAALGRSV